MYIYFLLSFLLCAAATPLVRMTAHRKGWLAHPVKDRWHKKPTALFGGIAIYIGVSLPLFWVADFQSVFAFAFPAVDHSRLPSVDAVIWIGITFLFILGLTDDFIQIKPHTKLVGQILVASMAAFFGFRIHWFTSLTLDTIVTIVWIVGISNALNLIDNMDGLCTGIGAIAAVFLAIMLEKTMPHASCVAMMMAGSLTAFLIFNFNPASIFMGDCGSLVIGFVLSMLCLFPSETLQVNAFSVYAIPVMVLMVPILDTTMVTLIRLLSGRKASIGGRDHTSHRLVLMGFSEKGTVLFLYGVGALSGVAALFVSRSDNLTSPLVIIPVILSILLMGIYLAQIRVYPEKEFSVLRNRSYTPILIELTYKKQIALVILDFCLIAFAYYLSYRLRFNYEDFSFYFQRFLHSLPAIIACKFIAFFVVGVYRGFWLFMSTDDVLGYLKATFFGTLLSVVAMTYIYRFEDFSKGLFIIDWLLTTALLLGTRGSFRILSDITNRKTLDGDKVLIYGAGRGGEILLRELINNKKHFIQPVGFIDDDELKIGKKLQGYPVLGSYKDLESLCDKHLINGILISFNNHEGSPENLNAIKQFSKTRRLFLRQFSIGLKDMDLNI